MKNLKSFVLVGVIAVLFTACGDSDNTKIETKETGDGKVTETVSDAAPKVGMIWKSIEQKQEEVKKIMSAGDFEHLHETRDIVNFLQTLPARSASLGEEKINQMNSLIIEMNKLSLQIDELSHSGKSSEVPALYTTFEAKLKEVKSMYPKESFED